MNLAKNPLNAGSPSRPKTLSAEAAIEWDRLVAELTDAGIMLTRAHRALLEMAATLAADLADAREVMDTEPYVTNEKTGAIQAHPATRRVDSLRRDYIKVLSLLGLRSTSTGEKPGEDLEDVLNS